MKRKSLIIIPLLGAGLLSSCGIKTNIATAVDVNITPEEVNVDVKYEENLEIYSSDLIPPEMDGRSVDETWKEYSVYIPFNGNDKTRYYTSEPGDFISDIAFNTGWLTRRTLITYNTNFYMWDDLQAQFFFDNGYTTIIKNSNTPIAAATIALSKSDVNKYDLKNHYICKIRVRTVD